QYPFRLQPAMGVFKENQFESLVPAPARFPVVRRIEIKERDRFHRTANIHCVGLQNIDSERLSLLCPVCVDFYPVAACWRPLKQSIECHHVTHAWIEGRKFTGTGQYFFSRLASAIGNG